MSDVGPSTRHYHCNAARPSPIISHDKESPLVRGRFHLIRRGKSQIESTYYFSGGSPSRLSVEGNLDLNKHSRGVSRISGEGRGGWVWFYPSEHYPRDRLTGRAEIIAGNWFLLSRINICEHSLAALGAKHICDKHRPVKPWWTVNCVDWRERRRERQSFYICVFAQQTVISLLATAHCCCHNTSYTFLQTEVNSSNPWQTSWYLAQN